MAIVIFLAWLPVIEAAGMFLDLWFYDLPRPTGNSIKELFIASD